MMTEGMVFDAAMASAQGLAFQALERLYLAGGNVEGDVIRPGNTEPERFYLHFSFPKLKEIKLMRLDENGDLPNHRYFTMTVYLSTYHRLVLEIYLIKNWEHLWDPQHVKWTALRTGHEGAFGFTMGGSVMICDKCNHHYHQGVAEFDEGTPRLFPDQSGCIHCSLEPK